MMKKWLIILLIFCRCPVFGQQQKQEVSSTEGKESLEAFAPELSSYKDSLIISQGQALLSKPYKENVLVSYYADRFHGRRTASGVMYDKAKMTAAHKKIPFGTKLKVTNPKTGKWVLVEVNDRGPFGKIKELDLSKAAYLELAGSLKSGITRAHIEILE